jgi:hypothetical protein
MRYRKTQRGRERTTKETMDAEKRSSITKRPYHRGKQPARNLIREGDFRIHSIESE